MEAVGSRGEEKNMARLSDRYTEEIAPALMKRFNYSSPMAVPKVSKIVLNMGVGDAIGDKKLLEQAVDEMTTIAAQRPTVTHAKKSISNFKLREGMSIGCKVTLRGTRMYEFLDRLMNLALPRVRDFRGVSAKGFDGRGNYTLGVRDELIFPEIDYNKVQKVKGLNVCIVTSAKTDEEARVLLDGFGMPFKK
jgi:large subunit ribosomal protein L5